MCKILTYEQIDRFAWSALVQSSSTGTWFQTPEAYDFFASQPELFAPFAIGIVSKQEYNSGLINEERLCGVCVGYVTKEKSAVKQFFTRRAIIIGGPALADDTTDVEVEMLMKAVRLQLVNCHMSLVNAPIYIETRNFNDYSKWRTAFEEAGFSYQLHLNFHVDCTDKEKMWERMSKTRQKQIRRAIRSGVEVIEPIDGDIKKWYAILQQMYQQKVKLPLLPVEFFEEAYRSRTAKFLMVKYNGEIIGGLMFETDEECVYEWYVCGLDTTYERQYPSVIATYAGMEYANAQGKRRCDLMGAGEPGVPYGVRDFKAEFGGELVEHGRWLYVVKPWLYKMGELGVRWLRR